MRGEERSHDGLFSYVPLEQRVPQDHPLRAIRQLTGWVLASLDADFDQLWSAVDSTGIDTAGAAVTGLLLYQFRAFAGRADRLQSAVSLVCWPRHGRSDLEPCCVFEEPRPAAEHRCSATFLSTVSRI